MVKLLELCKSYVDLRTETPKPRSRRSTRTEEGNGAQREELFIPAVRDVGRESSLLQQRALRSLPVERQRGPTTSETLGPTILSESGSAEVEGSYGQIIDRVSRFFEAAATEAISPGGLRAEAAKTKDLAADLALAPQAGEDLLAEALRTFPDGERSVVSHSAFVAVLAAYVGHKLGLSAVRLADTCLAGLTHDVGSVRLSLDALDHEASLSPQKSDELRKLPEYSREILESLGDRYSAAAEIAYQVYERLDGSGYPRGIGKDAILSEARVLGAVDFFETVVHPQPFTGASVGGVTYGLQTLVRMTGQFGRDTLKALVHCIGIFPVGTYVCLSTGEIGRVVSTSRSNPMRPIVDVVLDGKKRRPKMPKSVDLVHSPQLYVSRPLSNSDVVELGLLNHPANSDGGGSGNFSETRPLPERSLPSSSRSELGASVPE